MGSRVAARSADPLDSGKTDVKPSGKAALAQVATVPSTMRPAVLSAAGYVEFDPIAPNDTPEGRAKNRRTEITLEPNINELVAVPSAPN